jgi:hypothetical protein
MKQIISLFIATIIYSTSIGQFAARMEVKEPIKGVCDNKNVYVLFPMFKGQEEAICPASKTEIVKRFTSVLILVKHIQLVMI